MQSLLNHNRGRSRHGHRRPKHLSPQRYRRWPSEGRPERFFDPCKDYYVSADNVDRLPRTIGDVKTRPLFWRVMATIARLSRNGVCRAGVRRLAVKAGCSIGTLIKYRKAGVSLGMIGYEGQPGKGPGRETSLCWPLRAEPGKPNYWSYFGDRAESKFDTNLKTPSKKGGFEITSIDIPTEANPVVPDEPVSAAESGPPSVPADKPEPEKSHAETPRWSYAAVATAILTVLGWRLHWKSAKTIANTCHKRKLTHHSPEDVMRIVVAKGSEEFGDLAAERITNPGGFVNAACQRTKPEEIPKLLATLEPVWDGRMEFSTGTADVLVGRKIKQNKVVLPKGPPAANPINNPNSAPEPDPAVDWPDDGLTYEQRKSRLEARSALRPRDVKPVEMIDRGRGDAIMRELGLDPEDVLAWVWDHPPRPAWPLIPEDFEKLVERYRRANPLLTPDNCAYRGGSEGQ